MRHLVVIKEGPSSFGAYVPELRGCVVVGGSRAEASSLIREATEFQPKGMKEAGLPIHEPHFASDIVEIDA